MELLPLPVIGWLSVIFSAIAIGLGAWLIVGLLLQGEEMRAQLAARVIDDVMLFGIWLLGFAGGIGILLGKPWSRWMMELFSWALIVMVLLSSYARLRIAPPPRAQMVMGHLVFLIPIVAFCVATILTLRSETALRALAG